MSAFNKPPTLSRPQQMFFNASNNNNNNSKNNNNPQSDNNNAYTHSYGYNSPHIDNIRNMDILGESPLQHSYFASPSAPSPSIQFGSSSYNTPSYSPYTHSYSSALSESLADTPGVSISPLSYESSQMAHPSGIYGNPNETMGGNYYKLEVS